MRILSIVQSSAAAAVILLMGVGTAQAATLVGPPTGALGIDELNVGGTLYDVAFELATRDDGNL